MHLLFLSDFNLSIIKMLVPAFMAILFLQSGIDKVLDYKGNLDYYKEHFKKSPLANTITLLTPILTVLELAACILCSAGVIALFFNNSNWAFWGLITSSITLLSLFFGQRFAKDYAGAVTITTYFILNMIGLILVM